MKFIWDCTSFPPLRNNDTEVTSFSTQKCPKFHHSVALNSNIHHKFMQGKLWHESKIMELRNCEKKNIWFHSPRSKSTSWNQNVSIKEQSENTIWNYRFPFFPEVFIDATCIRVKIALEALGRSSTISVREALPSLSLHFVILILWIFYEAMALS